LAISASLVGSFTLLKKKALVGDAVAHAVLPGVCLAFMLAGEKNPIYLIIGAFITGWIALVGIDYIVANSKLKEDTAIGLILSVFFGVGILLLTKIQHGGNTAQSGLDAFLFGKAAAMVGIDVIVFSVVSIILILVVFLFFKELTLISFDEAYAVSIGYQVRKLELLLTSLTVMAVVVGIQAVGVVLMAAMLITPAAAARFWTDDLKIMLLLAAIFGAFSGVFGAYISYTAPGMPTGPWVVMVLSCIALLSFFLAPRKGILFLQLHQWRIQKRILEENILKTLYQLGEKEQDYQKQRSYIEISNHRDLPKKKLKSGLSHLRRMGFLEQKDDLWQLTIEGVNKGKRTIKLHRLWEVYLTAYLRIAPDHVHDDAESMEHIITPEIEKKLEKLLNYPTQDPHDSNIPY
jgi:manganese/zinc/iron transport system permease protein